MVSTVDMSQYDICQLPSIRYSGGAMGPYDVAANHVQADACGSSIGERVSDEAPRSGTHKSPKCLCFKRDETPAAHRYLDHRQATEHPDQTRPIGLKQDRLLRPEPDGSFACARLAHSQTDISA